MGDREEGMYQEGEEITLKIKIEDDVEERLEEEEDEDDDDDDDGLSYFREFKCVYKYRYIF